MHLSSINAFYRYIMVSHNSLLQFFIQIYPRGPCFLLHRTYSSLTSKLTWNSTTIHERLIAMGIIFLLKMFIKLNKILNQFDPVDNMYNYDLWDQKNKWGDPKISPKLCRSSLQITVHQEKIQMGLSWRQKLDLEKLAKFSKAEYPKRGVIHIHWILGVCKSDSLSL